MRFLASMILTAALTLPAMAQPRPGLDRFPGQPGNPGPAQGPNNQQAEIEKLKAAVKELEAKLNKPKEGERKPEAKKEEAKKFEPQRDEQRGPGFRGQGPMGMGNPMGGEGFRPNPMGFGGGQGAMNFPGMNNLSPEEQATFRKLVAKMSGQQQDRKPEGKQPEGDRKPDVKQPDRKPDVKQPDRKPENPNPGAKQNLEERLDRLEKMMQELMRNQNRK